MYSNEIAEYVRLRNYVLTIYEYCDIIKTSPQIDHIKYEDELFKLYTNDGYQFKLKIKDIKKD